MWAPGTSCSARLVSYSLSDLEKETGQHQPSCSCWRYDSFLSVRPDSGTSLTVYLCCIPSVAEWDGADVTGSGAGAHVEEGAVRVGRAARGEAGAAVGAADGTGAAAGVLCVESVPCAGGAPGVANVGRDGCV